MYILDKANHELVEAEIVPAAIEEMPLKKEGWSFNWSQLYKISGRATFVLKRLHEPGDVEGVLQLRVEAEMLIMDLLEIAPHNIGSKSKKYDYVAGCLIAFACRKSFEIEGNYRGFLTFVSKTELIDWYRKKYGAIQALGQRMYIDPNKGLQLIEEYLNRKANG